MASGAGEPAYADPEKLWAESVRVAGRHGIGLTARTLRLSAQELRRRATNTPPGAPGEPPASRFVEVNPVSLAAPVAYVVELVSVDGMRMRIESPSPDGLDVEALARTFLRSSPCSR